MNFLSFLKKYLVNAGLTDEQYAEIHSDIVSSNRRDLRAFTSLAVIAMSGMVIASFVVDLLSPVRMVYVTGFVCMLTIFVLARTIADKCDRTLYILIYAFMLVLLFFGISLGIIDSYDLTSTSFIAMLMACPMLFVQRPLRMNVTLLIAMVGFCIAAYGHKKPNVYETDVVNVVVFGLISMAVNTYMTCIRVERFYLQTQLRRMGETDQLTGLRNRHSYDATIRHYMACRTTPIYCLYVDVNGLHELNDTQGHEAGDHMLITVGSRLRETFGETDAYRIGGDEFVAIGDCTSKEEKLERLTMFMQEVEQAGYHVAVGLEFGVPGDVGVDAMIERAEKKMYADKAIYYKQSGKDRRRRSARE